MAKCSIKIDTVDGVDVKRYALQLDNIDQLALIYASLSLYSEYNEDINKILNAIDPIIDLEES